MRSLLLALAACTGTPDSDTPFAGPVEGTDAVIGLAGGRLYLCGGPETMGELNRWFDVDVSDGLFGEDDGWSVIGERDGDGWTGDLVDPTGGISPFTLDPATGADGPYAAESPVGECPVGAVVLDGRMQGVACAAVLAPAQVVPVGVIGAGRDPIEVRTEGEPALEFVVVPVEP